MFSFGKIGVGVFFILCNVGASKAEIELPEDPFQSLIQVDGPDESKFPVEDDQDMLKQIQNILENSDPSFDPISSVEKRAAIRCAEGQCSICQRVQIKPLGINENCCITVAYLKSNIGLLTTLTIGGRTIFTQEISVKNPKPVCHGVPFFSRIGSVCIQLHDLSFASRQLRGCSTLSAHAFFASVFKLKLGCFTVAI